MENSLPKNTPIIFEKGKDPGEGYLRVVGNIAKMEKINSDPSRQIRLKNFMKQSLLLAARLFLRNPTSK